MTSSWFFIPQLSIFIFVLLLRFRRRWSRNVEDISTRYSYIHQYTPYIIFISSVKLSCEQTLIGAGTNFFAVSWNSIYTAVPKVTKLKHEHCNKVFHSVHFTVQQLCLYHLRTHIQFNIYIYIYIYIFIYIHLFIYQISPTCLGTYCTILRENSCHFNRNK